MTGHRHMFSEGLDEIGGRAHAVDEVVDDAFDEWLERLHAGRCEAGRHQSVQAGRPDHTPPGNSSGITGPSDRNRA